jgi:hypothetical protein
MKNIFFLSVIIFRISFFAQSNAAKIQNLLANDSSTVRLLLGYPDSVRNAALMVAERPLAMARLESLQRSSSVSFRNLISSHSRERQKQLWNISRFPELPMLIVESKGKRGSELSEIFSRYGTETKKAAMHFAKHDNEAIVQMMNIQKDFNSGYRELIKNYPGDVKASFDMLMRYPELASAFSRDSATTRALGNIYSQDPALVKHTMDSAAQQFAKEYNREFEAWKNGISSDPEVSKDMKNLSREYKNDSDAEEDDVYAGAGNRPSNYSLNLNPYPYWAGYPTWYVAPYWYPYPWWWSAGYYWYPRRPAYFYGMPAYHFGYWYYNHPRNYYSRYPHAGNYFYHHYQSYPHSGAGMNHAVRQYNGGGNRMGGRGYQGGGGGNVGGGGYGRRR